MRAVTTALDVLAVLLLAAGVSISLTAWLGIHGLALGLVVGAFLVAGASASASRPPKSGGDAP